MKTAVIVGAGHAGSQCAVSLRYEGFDGKIYLINSEAAAPYHKPPLSKKYLRADTPEAIPLRAASTYEKADVQWRHGWVVSIDTAGEFIALQSGETLSYDYLVLATGARNRTVRELDYLPNVFSLRTLEDAAQLHAGISKSTRFSVLGGGFIGLEVAASMAGMGRAVTVIEAADRLLGRVVAEDVSHRVQAGLAQLGVRVLTGRRDTHFEVSNDTNVGQTLTGLLLDDNSMVNTDALLVGIGARPNSEQADDAGIACANGIVVNEFLQTSDENVFAIGDCANFPHWQTGLPQRLQSVQNAVDQAKCVAQSIARQLPIRYHTVPWFWSDIGHMKLQIAGIHNGDTEQVIREEGDTFALYHLREGQVVCVESINGTKEHLLARKLIMHGTAVSAKDIHAGLDSLIALM